MDNEQLLNSVQELLEGMEKRIDQRMDDRFGTVTRRLGLHGISGWLPSTANWPCKRVRYRIWSYWSDKIEDEVIRISTELVDVQARLAKVGREVR